MDAFRRNYGVYYSVLQLTGLWPYDESVLVKIHRVVASLVVLCCIVVQVSSITHVEITLPNLLALLSYTCPMILFFIRYVGFIGIFPVVKYFFGSMEYDCEMLEDPVEMRILLKNIEKSKQIVFMFFVMASLGILFALTMVLFPAILRFKYHLRIIQLLGFFYAEQNSKSDLVCLHLSAASIVGLLTLACTESALAVFSFYLSGLYEIVGYRIRTTVDNAAKLNSPDPINIGPAVDMHQKANESVPLCGFLAITEKYSGEEIAVCILVTWIHLVIIFLDNYSGQAVIDTSSQVFDDTYNSVWYRIPPKSQKMLLLLLVKSVHGVNINLAGLFVPCYEGFSMMLSSSFSYFTVLLSM